MSNWGPAPIGDRTTPLASASAPSRTARTASASAPLELSGLTISSRSASFDADRTRALLHDASRPLVAAFGAFTSYVKPVFTTTIDDRPAIIAGFDGTAARLADVAGSASRLAATVKVNTQTSTIRSSSSAIGLDVTPAHSTLLSNALTDLNTADAASSLTSTGTLGLNVVSASSTLTSTAEMNTATKSLSSYDLSFQGSTSRAELSGSYSGPATSLTLKMTAGADLTLGSVGALVSFDVLDEGNRRISSFTGVVTAGQAITLDIGVQVRFTAGTLKMAKQATTNVVSTPTTVSTSAAFNAGWSAGPRFESFRQVAAGSFTLNGVSIAVNANDSIDSVLSRINASAAGVTGTVVGDKVVLTSNSASESNITIGSDTSGFLLATKLSAATTTRGNIRDDQQVLSQTTQFAGVTSGSFQVNGVSISVNKDTDTLSSIISRINTAGAGVTASYDSAQDKVVLATTGYSESSITLSGDDTGFVASTRLSAATTVVGNIADQTQALSTTAPFAAVIDGTFQVNGATIAVDADVDSVASIVQKINDANAGVTAAFDTTTKKIELEATVNSEDQIVVSGDTTGFLAAAGLSTGNTSVGNISDLTQRLSETAAFAGVATGSFAINGVTIAVDPDADTLQDVITRINGAGAGVTASYDSVADRLAITPNTAGATLSIAGDTSGFVAAATLAEGVTGTRVNADGAFDGSNGSTPLFDPGVSVHAGSFTVNGVAISVAADDTVNSVLAKITASAAGVTATFDSTTQLVTLTSNAPTSTAIALGGDSSGFLAAVKLDGTAASTTGTATTDSFESPLASMAEYASVTSGQIRLNGGRITIDPNTTTLEGLVAAMDAINNINATLDTTTGQITVTSTSADGSISLSDTSGLLGALGIRTGTYSSRAASLTVTETQTGTEVVSNSGDIVEAVGRAASDLGSALSELASARAGDDAFLNELVAASEDAFAALRDAGVAGITIGGEGADIRLVIDKESLAEALDGLADPNTAVNSAATLLDELTARVAAAAAIEPEPASPATTYTLSRGQLLADQAAAAMLFLKALEQANGAAAESTERAAAVSPATRRQIVQQFQSLQSTGEVAVGSLIDTLITDL